MPIESSPEGVLDKSLEQVECKAEAGMPHVEHIIDAINVFDIKAVVVVPAGWPSLIISEPIATVLEAVIPAYHLRTHHAERVATAKTGTVTVVRNAAIMVPVVATIGSNGPWLLLACLLGTLWLLACLLGALRLCLVLRLLGALRLRLALCLLGALRLCLVLRLLGALRLCLALRLLGALRLRLVLRRLSALRLRLVLRRLCFPSALLLLFFLSECRKGGSEKQKQKCCADNSISVHRYCLQLMSHLPLMGYARHPCYIVCAHGCQFSPAHVLGQKCSSQLRGGAIEAAEKPGEAVIWRSRRRRRNFVFPSKYAERDPSRSLS